MCKIAVIYCIRWIYKQKNPPKNCKTLYSNNKFYLIGPVFCVWPHVLIHITPDIFSGKASWEESFGMPYPPLAVFSCDVLACSIHCIQEGHLVLWTMVKNLPSPGWEKLFNGVEERGVRGNEKGHHPRMGIKPGCDCTGMAECHIVPCDHIYWQVSHLSPFYLWHKSFVQVF